ncbi:GNAT family N-acetyltransferase [Paenibacillus sp. FSL W7-1088]|uniref:GNAT family N-acetyltransferase n=1 Tax=Paenibacillus sp. FSL W7-1088 TaxID=2921695 RepID=UPI0030EF53D9
MDFIYGEYLISDNKELMDIPAVKGFLARSYWANKRSDEKIEKSIHSSVCFGIYKEEIQVGFARVVTDDATMYWLCDVIIHEEYRGQGLGKKLIEVITQSDRFKDLMGLLGTLDAHELYEQYQFNRNSERFMIRLPDYLRA